MAELQKSRKAIRFWQAISWTGFGVFAAGYLATRYILSELFSVEISAPLDIILMLWLYPFLLMNARKQRRLGLYPAAGNVRQNGRPKTRWQAFVARANAWPDSVQALFGVLSALAVILGVNYTVGRFWTEHAEFPGIAALLAIAAMSRRRFLITKNE